jgi:hypothetical protein
MKKIVLNMIVGMFFLWGSTGAAAQKVTVPMVTFADGSRAVIEALQFSSEKTILISIVTELRYYDSAGVGDVPFIGGFRLICSNSNDVAVRIRLLRSDWDSLRSTGVWRRQ